ncbi:MAG TPA: response regulator [Rhodopirellula baltica]|uniref:Response regulator rcp1 n=1 Tax=Rhodopirellula baltica (strain DSM 10527 / NCIMB 13988 / SH1) TaxID=243090 RepID=Q7UEQ3_RHOBA|nr:response regulator [Rhodopirellula baltica]CAD78982.1 response regulator rcp1 [Rhodopirellula baltica SH 1]HBE64217.1 response regulator [Rhodopirellula baltica]
MSNQAKPIDILLAEDSETDAELTMDALQQGKIRNNIYHVWDGEEVLQFLRKEGEYKDAVRPDLILLDLNMPRMDGRTVLKELRSDDRIKAIPVVVLTTSSQERDIHESYGLAANNYIVKPVDLVQFFEVIQSVQEFWVNVVKLPKK